ncbi:uncharacterized protein [Diabrotica undecimpunctata]|uniref:uncharacterized protein n=1 Tax=Diabrotica undecimpunctata TaxID=50387 RepID=UPI003B63B2D6
MDEICRLCLRNDDNKKNIFDELLLSKSLYWTFGVQIKVSDKFSKLICEQCVNQLEYVRQLKTFYQKNQQYLHQQKFPLEFDSEVGNYDWLLERTTKLPEIPPILRSIPKDVCSAKKPKIDCTTGVLQYNIQDNLQSEKRIEHVNGLVPVVELPRLGDISEDGYRKINNNLYKKTSKKNPIQYRKKSIQHNSKLKSTLPFSVGKKVTANNGKHINNFIQRQKSKLYEYEEATAVNRQCDVDEITSKTTDPAKICDINGDISSKVNKTIIMKQAEKSDKTDDVLSKTSKITTDENSYVNNQKLVMRDVLRESQNFLNFIENKSTDQTTTVITIDDDKVPVNENLPPNNNQNMPINVTREKADISSINLIPEQFLVPGNDVQIIAVQQPNWNPKSFEVSETSMISANNKASSFLCIYILKLRCMVICPIWSNFSIFLFNTICTIKAYTLGCPVFA